MASKRNNTAVILGGNERLGRLQVHRELEYLRAVGDYHGRARRRRKKKAIMLARRARLTERSLKLKQVGR